MQDFSDIYKTGWYSHRSLRPRGITHVKLMYSLKVIS